MNFWIIFLIVAVVLAVVLVVLYRRADKVQEQQAEQMEKINEAAVPTTLLVIDKKRMPFKDAGFPKMVLDQAPKRTQNAKVPVVKAKIGPQIVTLLSDEDVFDEIPVKAQIKAMVSGIYIVSINNYRKAPVETPKKKGIMDRLRAQSNKAVKQKVADDEVKKQKENSAKK